MKKVSKIILISFLFLLSLNCIAQHSNYLTYYEYVAIKINGRSLLKITNTKGDKLAMNHLFNKKFNYESLTIPDYYKNFIDQDLNIQFLKDSNEKGVDYELDALKVLSSNVTIEIKGLTFKLGDSAINLQKYFIKNPKSGDFIFQINPNSNVFFGTQENDFLVKIKNNVITDIMFFVNT